MPFLPDWAPNVHPLIVHFPIALLIFALLFDLFALIFRNINWVRYAAGSLYILGALAAVITYLSGKQAADVVNIPAMANPTLTEHADWALYTVWFFGIYGVVRLVFLWKKLTEKWVISFVIFLVGAGGMALLYETAEHGAELVFRHGVGVKAAEEARQELSEMQARQEILAESGIVEQENGSWQWRPGRRAEIILEKQFNWLIGKPEAMNAKTIHDETSGDVLALDPQNTTALVTAAKPLKGVQVDMRIDLDQFRGRFMIVHHLQDSLNYDFVMLVKDSFPKESTIRKNEVMKLGRVTAGEEIVDDQANFQAPGWFTLRVVGEGRHFRGYVNDKLITHGHADELPPGPVGFSIQGSGILLVEFIKVQALSE
ncbi:MAG: hypothetical protein HUU32_04670 [Calditrichaceae bacterium]|nr:hypothetical protein [Calditrichia bacterium]NUQ40667.1 hypothetical protein [Calditrichaceae bacterium]